MSKESIAAVIKRIKLKITKKVRESLVIIMPAITAYVLKDSSLFSEFIENLKRQL